MLDEYCNKLPEATQVVMAIRLIEIVLPAWEKYVAGHPGILKQVNDLITKDHWVQGGAHHIAEDLPRAALLEMKSTIEAGKSARANAVLKDYLATFMEPLTIPAWEKIFQSPVRLVFTAVFNLLAFLLFKKVTPSNETHVYVAINQACDAILQKHVLSQEELERLLKEYEHVQAPPLDESESKDAGNLPMSIENMFASSFQKRAAHCPVCGSLDISQEAVHIEFTRMHCNACGNDDICDVWQLDDWYR